MRRTLRGIAAALLVALLLAQLPLASVVFAAEVAHEEGKTAKIAEPSEHEATAQAKEESGKPSGNVTEDRPGGQEQASNENDSQGQPSQDDAPEEVTAVRLASPPPLRAPTSPGDGSAYAVFDKSTRTLTFLRSNETLGDGPDQTITDISGNAHTGYVWGGVEELEATSAEEVPWHVYATPYNGFSSVSVAEGCTIRPKSCAWWFADANLITSADLTGLDTSRCTSLAHLFDGCSNLQSVNLTGFDTRAVTSMAYLFNYCRYLYSADLSSFDTTNVTDMSHMFCQCEHLGALDLAHFNTGNVTNMNSLFSLCYELTSLNITGWDTSRVTDMGNMFSALHSMTSIPCGQLNTSSVTNMKSMLAGEWLVESLDVSRFDTRNVTDMSSMFSSCEALKNLDLSNFVTPNLQGTSYMFQNCGALTRVDMSSLDMSGVQTADQMFTSCSALREVVLGEGFAFLPGSTRNNRLPSPTANGTYTGNWVNSENESQSFGASALASQYDGATMAGTWVWEQWHDCALTFDLVGGSAPAGQSYPTTYRMGQALALPGTKGSSLRNPTRSGYAFLNWTDEKGKKIEKIGTDSRGPRTITASWRALQIRVSVPVAETFVAMHGSDGTIRLSPEEGDFKLAVQSTGDAPVSVTAKATPAYGFSIGDSNTLSDGEADVWMTPTIAGWWASNDGYDPASDPTYQEYGEVRLSQLGAGKKIGPTLRAYDTLWLNKMGGVMGGWSNNTGAKTLLATINWTFELATEA